MLLRGLIVVMLTLLLPLSVAAKKEAPATVKHDFQGSSWGDSMKQVTGHEKAEVFKAVDGSAPLYKGTFLGIETVIGYTFSEDKKLNGGVYIFKTDYADKNDCVKDFTKVADWLTAKYGKPTSEKRLWESQQLKDEKLKDESKWGEALALGQMSLARHWMGENTFVTHSLEKVNNDLVHIVSFSDKKSVEEEKKPELKTPEDSKPEAKMPEEKTTKEKVSVEKKTEEKKPEEVKPGKDKKPEKTPEIPAVKTP